MSGHSKWSTIKRKKGAADARRGKLFARLIRGIEAAAKVGGSDPEANPTLADAIQKARDASMPRDNIERALKRAAGDVDAGHYDTVYYEGYAPGGVALYVECLTDNRNRAANEVRAAFNKNGGSLAEPGDVHAVRTALEDAGIPVASSETTMLPSVTVSVTSESVAKQVLRLLDALDDCDDVQNVYSNFDIPDDILQAVA